MDNSQFQTNPTKLNIFEELQADYITFEKQIEGIENYNALWFYCTEAPIQTS